MGDWSLLLPKMPDRLLPVRCVSIIRTLWRRSWPWAALAFLDGLGPSKDLLPDELKAELSGTERGIWTADDPGAERCCGASIGVSVAS